MPTTTDKRSTMLVSMTSTFGGDVRTTYTQANAVVGGRTWSKNPTPGWGTNTVPVFNGYTSLGFRISTNSGVLRTATWTSYLPGGGKPRIYGYSRTEQMFLVDIAKTAYRPETINTSIPELVNLRNRVNDDLLSKIAAPQVDMSVILAEANQTASYLCGVFTQLSDLAKAIRRGRKPSRPTSRRGRPKRNADDKRKKRKATKQQVKQAVLGTSQEWLKYQYAFVPLMSDTKSLAETVAGRLLDLPTTRYFRRKARGGWTAPAVRRNVINSGGVVQSEEYTDTYMYERGGAWQITNPELYVQNLLGLADPFSTAWEKVPYSFVVDYFVPIGQWLHSVHTQTGVTYYNGYETLFVQRSGVFRKTAHTGTTNYSDSTEVVVYESYHHRRTVKAAEPSFSYTLANQPELSLTKVTNLFALFASNWLGGGAKTRQSASSSFRGD